MYFYGQDVLVAVADAEQRERIAGIVAREGFGVTVAAEGLAALRALRQRRYALLVAAARLPGALDGGATLRQARRRQPWLKALLLGDAESPPRMKAEADEVIAARCARHELVGCVFELLHRSTAASADLACRARTARRTV